MFDCILVVCVGNICRSPIGERLLRAALPEKTITSAGIAALVGHAADEKAVAAAQKHHVELTGHVGKQLTKELCISHGLILAMEKKHIDAICNISPESRGKIMLFGHWMNQKEIFDPYRKSYELFEHNYNLINDAAQKWVAVFKKH